MSEGLNKWCGLGFIGADPELRQTERSAILKFRMATTENIKKQNAWAEHTEWISVVVFGRRAESLGEFLVKGSRVYVEGPLRTTSYDDKQGIKRYRTEVNADKVLLCGGKGEKRAESEPQTRAGTGYDEDQYGKSGGGEDEIPF